MKKNIEPLAPTEKIENRILLVRGRRIILDTDLAELYGVMTKRLNEQVKRNRKRFPEDFMFQLSMKEKSELVANCDRFANLKHSSSMPYAFTEHGAMMTANILNSEKAIDISVFIVRAFVRIREMLETSAKFAAKLKELEDRMDMHDENTIVVMSTLRKLLNDSAAKAPLPAKQKIGFPV
jgi:phage regulator Rha-like protein